MKKISTLPLVLVFSAGLAFAETGSTSSSPQRTGGNVDSGVGNTTTTGNSTAPGTTSGPGVTSPAEISASAATLTDAEIAGILKAANEAEIEAAQVAKRKAVSQGVKDFADHMIQEHRTNAKETKRIQQSARLKPTMNAEAKAMARDAKAKVAALRKLRGDTLDKAYVSQQVEMHASLLQSLDDKLIPSAKGPELKAHLEKTRTHVATHLDKAKALLASGEGGVSNTGGTTTPQ